MLHCTEPLPLDSSTAGLSHCFAKMKIRFSIKAILVLIACSAIAVVVHQHWMFERRWSGIRTEIESWSEELRNSKRNPSYVRTVVQTDGSMMHLAIGTAPIQIVENSISHPRVTETNAYGNRFFIQPPGTWVPDIETAIKTWDSLNVDLRRH